MYTIAKQHNQQLWLTLNGLPEHQKKDIINFILQYGQKIMECCKNKKQYKTYTEIMLYPNKITEYKPHNGYKEYEHLTIQQEGGETTWQ